MLRHKLINNQDIRVVLWFAGSHICELLWSKLWGQKKRKIKQLYFKKSTI